jgi:ribosomal protein S18 acetylase RimI-like enzyme
MWTSTNVRICPLKSLESARFAEIASGYTSQQRYFVRREATDGRTVFTVELEDLDQTFVKRWQPEEDLIDRYRQVISEDRLSLGAYVGDLLVGAAIAEPRPWNQSLWVWELHVHADYRGQGIGRRLMEELADQAQLAGLHVIVAETQNTNVPAIRFYRSVGFELEGLDLSLYPPEIEEVAFFMKRYLNVGRRPPDSPNADHSAAGGKR